MSLNSLSSPILLNFLLPLSSSLDCAAIKCHSMPFRAESPHAIKCHSLLPGIVFDTRACLGVFLLRAGYRFRYPCLLGLLHLRDGYRFRYLWLRLATLFDYLIE